MRNEISGVTWQRPISQPVLTGAKIVPLSSRRIQWRAYILAGHNRAPFRRSRSSYSSHSTPRDKEIADDNDTFHHACNYVTPEPVAPSRRVDRDS